MAAESNAASPAGKPAARSEPDGTGKPRKLLRIVVLLSGRGSNFQAISEACSAKRLSAEVVAVISDRPSAGGLELAKQLSIPTVVVPRRPKEISADTFFEELATAVTRFSPDLVVLAGFMRVVSPSFIAKCGPAILNIHPSLLPAFRGIQAQAQALAAGVKYTGCTVHVVVPELDSGPILDQAVVPVKVNDTVESLAQRILEEEHRILPAVLQQIATGEITIGRSESGEVQVVRRA